MIVEKKKYIIELPENTHWIQWIMESTKDHHPFMDYKQAEDLTPYTEPDLDAIRKEAYDKAFEDAEQVAESGKKAMYQKGLNDAREGKASCQFCEYEMCSDRFDPCRICACNYTNFFEPKKQEEMDGLRQRQNIQIIVDQCGYTLDEIAEALRKMKE